MEVVHAVIAIAAAIVMIIRFKIDPVIALIISCIYLGLAGGVGIAGTVEGITTGFGEIMIKVGLLIGFGVLIGSLLHATGTFRDLVELIARRVGGKLPYAMAATLATIFPSIYVDVQVVLSAPMARQSAHMVDRRFGLPWLAGSMGIGIFAGYVFVVPGLAAVAVAGLLGVPLGKYLMYGICIGLATALLTTVAFRLILRAGMWDEATDIDHESLLEEEADEQPAIDVLANGGPESPTLARRPSLLARLSPILVPLVLIAFGAFADLGGFSNDVIAFLGNANIALFIGLLIAFWLARRVLGTERTNDAMSTGFHTTGEILLITGVGGSLGAIIKGTGLDDTLSGLFSADAGSPVILSIVLAWFIAAVLHFAIGSVSVGAIAAGGIIAPIVGSLGVDPVVIALAIASGAMFALHVNSNFFWMFKSLLGLSTKGALKTLTLATSIGAVVSLPLVMIAAAVSAIG